MQALIKIFCKQTSESLYFVKREVPLPFATSIRQNAILGNLRKEGEKHDPME